VVNDLGVARDGTQEGAEVAAEVTAEITGSGGSASANTDDVSSQSGVQALVAHTVASYGRIDILVNNAGIVRDKPLLRMDEAAFRTVIETDLTAAFLTTQAVAQRFKDQGNGGKIVNTTSISGMLGNLGQANMAAAKAGIYGLTRTASIELQRYGITVNAVAPLAKTRMTEDLPMFEQVDSMRPEHVAPVHLFLASDLSHDLTGVVVSVAGGKLAIYKLAESHGRFKESDGGVWSAREIADHWDSISKL
jgi:NAD(P)-dependent dehydrogenase (short-subunit alcohol dehydrogenase family)